MGFWAAALPFISAAAPVVAGALGFAGGERQNAASAYQAQLNRDFQENLSRTAHQRQVTDLKKAGLNPILSARYGGASTPGGSMAPQVDSIGAGVSTAMQARMNRETVRNAKSTNRLINNQADNAEWLADKTQAEANTARSVQEMYGLDSLVRSERFHGDMADARAYNRLPDWAREGKYYGQSLGPVGGLAASAKGLLGLGKYGFGKPKLRIK